MRARAGKGLGEKHLSAKLPEEAESVSYSIPRRKNYHSESRLAEAFAPEAQLHILGNLSRSDGSTGGPDAPHYRCKITSKGYSRLRISYSNSFPAHSASGKLRSRSTAVSDGELPCPGKNTWTYITQFQPEGSERYTARSDAASVPTDQCLFLQRHQRSSFTCRADAQQAVRPPNEPFPMDVPDNEVS